MNRRRKARKGEEEGESCGADLSARTESSGRVVLEEMKEAGVDPDDRTFNAAIDARRCACVYVLG